MKLAARPALLLVLLALPSIVAGWMLGSWLVGSSLLLALAGPDLLAALGNSRRCLHDHLAGTRVVRA